MVGPSQVSVTVTVRETDPGLGRPKQRSAVCSSAPPLLITECRAGPHYVPFCVMHHSAREGFYVTRPGDGLGWQHGSPGIGD